MNKPLITKININKKKYINNTSASLITVAALEFYENVVVFFPDMI